MVEMKFGPNRSMYRFSIRPCHVPERQEVYNDSRHTVTNDAAVGFCVNLPHDLFELVDVVPLHLAAIVILVTASSSFRLSAGQVVWLHHRNHGRFLFGSHGETMCETNSTV